MPEELKNIADSVMSQIRQGKLKMRPKIYFILGSVFTMAGLAAAIAVSVFLVSLIRFAFRVHGPIGQYRLDQLLSVFPWWAPVLAVVGLAVGIWLLRQYEFSYKTNFWVIIIGFIAAIVIVGWMMDLAGWDEILFRHGPMRGMMRQYFLEEGGRFLPGPGWRQ